MHVTLGAAVIALNWIAVMLSTAAAFFWGVASFCTRRSNRTSRGKRHSPKLPLTLGTDVAYNGAGGSRSYKKLDDQEELLGQNPGIPLQETAQAPEGPFKGREDAYEPYRHVQN